MKKQSNHNSNTSNGYNSGNIDNSNGNGNPSGVRIIAHIDMDCFYVQVERRLNPSLLCNQPVAVVQYNPFGDIKTLHAHDNRILTPLVSSVPTSSSSSSSSMSKGSINNSIIAVSYEARARGVKRSMRGNEARATCPDIILVQVPTAYQKADLTIYREAGENVVTLLRKQLGYIVEKASIDEVYIDLTNAVTTKYREMMESKDVENIKQEIGNIVSIVSQCRVAGDDKEELSMSRRALSHGHQGTSHSNEAGLDSPALSTLGKGLPFTSWALEDKYIAIGACLVKTIRQRIFDDLKFTCSAGVGHNKMLAKIASAMHKPNKQTIAPTCVVHDLMKLMPISRVPGFGGKLGHELNSLGVNCFGDIQRNPVTHNLLRTNFDRETAERIIGISLGIENEPVKDRFLVKNIGCSKMFHRNAQWLDSKSLKDGRLERWLRALGSELLTRVQVDMASNERRPKNLGVGISVANMDATSGAMVPNIADSLDLGTSVKVSEDELEESSRAVAGVDAWEDMFDDHDLQNGDPSTHLPETASSSEPNVPVMKETDPTGSNATSLVYSRYSSSEHMSRVCPMKFSLDGIVESCFNMVKFLVTDNVKLREPWRIKSMGLIASNFEVLANEETSIKRFFTGPKVSQSQTSSNPTSHVPNSDDSQGTRGQPFAEDKRIPNEYFPRIHGKDTGPSAKTTITAWVSSPTKAKELRTNLTVPSTDCQDTGVTISDEEGPICIEIAEASSDDTTPVGNHVENGPQRKPLIADTKAPQVPIDRLLAQSASESAGPSTVPLIGNETIDLSVFHELPLEIQRELKFALRGSKQFEKLSTLERGGKDSSAEELPRKKAKLDAHGHARISAFFTKK